MLEIDPDITRARTPGAPFYLDDAVFAAVRERVFARSWQWLDGDLADVAEPSTLAPRTLLPGLLDEPLLLARDGAGALRCLPNVCTHRGHLLVDAPCRRDDIRCPYHSRRFDLDGRMRFMPGFEGMPDFPDAKDHLRALPFEQLGPLAFTALDEPGCSFDALQAPLRAHLPQLALDTFVHDPSRDRAFEFDAHWALYVENYLEGLHIPFLHPGLMQALDWQRYRYQLHPWSNLQLGLDERGGVAAHYFWWFPNLMLNVYPWGLSLNQVQPLGPARTRVVFRSYVTRPELLGQGAGGALDQVEMEDEAAVQSVQRGLRARSYRGGRYSPLHERGVHQFHRLLAQCLAA